MTAPPTRPSLPVDLTLVAAVAGVVLAGLLVRWATLDLQLLGGVPDVGDYREASLGLRSSAALVLVGGGVAAWARRSWQAVGWSVGAITVATGALLALSLQAQEHVARTPVTDWSTPALSSLLVPLVVPTTWPLLVLAMASVGTRLTEWSSPAPRRPPGRS